MPHRRLRDYLLHDIWAPLPEGASRLRAWARGFLRLWVLAARGLKRDHTLHNASALAFDTVLALVPMLAIFFSTLRGLGVYGLFVDGTVRPWIDSTFGPAGTEHAVLREAFLKLLDFGSQTDMAALGLMGVAFLLYLVLVLLHTVETVLNGIWGVQEPRSTIRKVADYSAILFVIPFGLYLASLGAGPDVDTSWLGPLHDAAIEGAKLAGAALVLTFLYLVMPNTGTAFRSAALGGLVGGFLWYALTTAYGAFQIGVARYSAVYSSFAAVPLFLVWVFVSWLAILFGAELAAAHQNQASFRWRVLHPHASPSTKRFLGVRLAVDIADAFLAGRPPRTLAALAADAGVPERLAKDVLDILVDHGLLAAARHHGQPAYVPARDVHALHVTALLGAIEHAPADADMDLRGDPAGRRLAAVLASLDEAAERSGANATVAQLVAKLATPTRPEEPR